MLDAIIDYLPSPLDVPPVHGTDPNRRERSAARSDAPLAALAFKIAADPHVGKLAYVRVYSGTMTSGTYALNSSKGQRERVGRVLQMHSNHREEIPAITAGNIAAVIGFKSTTTGDTLCDSDQPIVLESITFPEPVISVSIEPKTRADQDKMANALQRLAEEDPTFRVKTDEESGQTVIDGMGELHLEVIVDRMMREFRVDANVGRPQVAYRRRYPAGEGRGAPRPPVRRQGQYGHVVVEFELRGGAGYDSKMRLWAVRSPASTSSR